MSQSASPAMATGENFAIHAQEHRVKLTHHNLKININEVIILAIHMYINNLAMVRWSY